MARGGKRAGAGRPQLGGGAVRKTIVLSEDDLAYLQSLDKNLSFAIRTLIKRVQAGAGAHAKQLTT